ncbi:MAG TPA: glutaminyl-peptide cyclotransferase [Pseudonocardia sp.]|nr:glutaminyl-peptide cyclotransferase [Pseudonocardia sp.]
MTIGRPRSPLSGTARRPFAGPRGSRPGALLAALALITPMLVACGGDDEARQYDPTAMAGEIAAAVAAGLPSPKVTVLATLPHSTDAWTEGLEISDGLLYEGTGIVGRSELRELDPKTGKLLRSAPLPPGLYGEGITVVGSLIWQLTWKDGIALEWNRDLFTAGGRVPWQGEGWGLCHTGEGELVASNGSDQIRTIDRNGTVIVDLISVTVKGQPLEGLNELECGPKSIWANVYGTYWIVEINPDSGEVVSAVDASKIVPAAERGNADHVLNGIAAVPGAANTFLLTGKQWSTMYRVRFGEGGDGESGDSAASSSASSGTDGSSTEGRTGTTGSTKTTGGTKTTGSTGASKTTEGARSTGTTGTTGSTGATGSSGTTGSTGGTGSSRGDGSNGTTGRATTGGTGTAGGA